MKIKRFNQHSNSTFPKEISISDIKPKGNIDEILQNVRVKADTTIKLCNDKKEYNKSLAKLIEFATDITSTLEEAIGENNNIWSIDEAKMCLLYGMLIIIDLNQTAHTFLNSKITKLNFPSRVDQLQEFVESKKQIFGNLKITE